MILMLVVVGILLVFAVMIVSIVFTVIGIIKSNEGERYEYPLTIQFIK